MKKKFRDKQFLVRMKAPLYSKLKDLVDISGKSKVDFYNKVFEDYVREHESKLKYKEI